MKRALALATMLSAVLAGCDAVPAEDAAAQTCIGDSFQSLVGGTEAEALDTLADVLLFTDPPPVVRYIRPGDAVTMDFRPDRTNIELDDAGIVTRVYCG